MKFGDGKKRLKDLVLVPGIAPNAWKKHISCQYPDDAFHH